MPRVFLACRLWRRDLNLIIIKTKIMSITFDKKSTLAEASLAWLTESKHLAESTRKSYRGEVDRLGQYLAAKFGLLHVGDLQRDHWEKYIRSVGRGRREVATRRQDVLSASSAIQAVRINRQFLMWCAKHELIDWIPNRTVQSRQVRESKQTNLRSLPVEVSRALLGKVELEDVEVARAVFGVNLAYWGALDAVEISRLKVEDLVLAPSPHLKFQGDGRSVKLPDHLSNLWKIYRRFRYKSLGVPVNKNAPLISHLRAEKPVRPWSIWAMIKQWQERWQIDQYVSPRSLRMNFLRSVADEQSANLAVALFHAGNATYSVRASATEASQRIRKIQDQAKRRLETFQR